MGLLGLVIRIPTIPRPLSAGEFSFISDHKQHSKVVGEEASLVTAVLRRTALSAH